MEKQPSTRMMEEWARDRLKRKQYSSKKKELASKKKNREYIDSIRKTPSPGKEVLRKSGYRT